MKKLALLLLAIAPLCAQASANFEGPYAGVTFGYVTGQDSGREYADGVFDQYTLGNSPDGSLLGIVAGYGMLLCDNLVLGIEADYEFTRADDIHFQQKPGGTHNSSYPVETALKSAASLRARIGCLLNKQRTLAYLTAGYALAEVERTFTNLGTGTVILPAPVSEKHTDWHDGWTAGLGLEHMLNDRVSLRVEYRYSAYGRENIGTSIYSQPYQERQKYDDEHAVRLGILYHF